MRELRRELSKRIISKRKSKLKYIRSDINVSNIEDGYFENNSIMNSLTNYGRSKKTNTRKGHSSYRHKGTYGKANNYSPHDLRQIQKEVY